MNPYIMNPHVEKAYRAYRATVTDDADIRRRIQGAVFRQAPVVAPPRAPVVVRSIRPPIMSPAEKPRKYAGTGRYKRTAAHKEAARKGALTRWAKAKSAKNPQRVLWGEMHAGPPATPFVVARVTPREAILDVLRAKGPLSKAEIIERAGLTPGRKSVPHFSGLLRTKTIRKVGDKVALAKVRR